MRIYSDSTLNDSTLKDSTLNDSTLNGSTLNCQLHYWVGRQVKAENSSASNMRTFYQKTVKRLKRIQMKDCWLNQTMQGFQSIYSITDDVLITAEGQTWMIASRDNNFNP